MVLPEGFGFPPAAYAVPVSVVLVVVGGLLWHRRPPVTDRTVGAAVPWMLAGAAAHVLQQVGGVPDVLAPLFGVPMVYLSVTALAGAVWLVAGVGVELGLDRDPETDLLVVGSIAAVIALAATAWFGVTEGAITPVWPTASIVLTAAVSAIAWLGFRRWYPDTARRTRFVGPMVLFAHALDAITTVVGLDVLGGSERSPLVALLVGWGGELPTAAVLGDAWPFIPLKVGLALLVVEVLAEPLEGSPSAARLATIGVIALGLAPGVHNLLLFLLGV